MRLKFIVPICCLTLLLTSAGCNYATKGGGGKIIYNDIDTTTEIVAKDGTKTTTHTRDNSVNVDVEQPASPESPAVINVFKDKSGHPNVTLTTGKAQNNVKTLAAIDMLDAVIYAGIGLIILGAVVGILFKQIIWAIGIAGTGALMIIGSFLLVQYAGWFLLGLGVAVAFGGYLLYDYFRKHKALDQIVTTVEAGKASGAVDPDKFAKVADKIQSKSTSNLVDKVKSE